MCVFVFVKFRVLRELRRVYALELSFVGLKKVELDNVLLRSIILRKILLTSQKEMLFILNLYVLIVVWSSDLVL